MINIDRLRKFVSALEAATTMNPSLRVIDLKSVEPPSCGTPGCHAGLAKEALDILGVDPVFDGYSYEAEAYRLSNYLAGEEAPYEILLPPNDLRLCQWAKNHPIDWGSMLGDYMFSSALAFNRENYSFPSSELVEWWRLVLERLEREQQRSLIAEVGNE